MDTKRILLIVDPQIDFISGTLPVPGATEAMQRLARWIDDQHDLYDSIVLTMDQHPIGHCSFIGQGGQWPPHCVRYTEGASIFPPIHEALSRAVALGKELHYMEKATTLERDEYSAFSQQVPEILRSAQHIYLTGLAGDYCVAESERDLLKVIPCERLERLESCIAYINPPKR